MVKQLVQGYLAMDNDKKLQKYRKQKIEKWILIIMCIGVITLEILALLDIINMIWGCVLFIIIYLFKKIVLK